MILQWVDIDVAFMITSPPTVPGFAEVLCRTGVSRGARPNFSGPPQDYIVFPTSPDFGAVRSIIPTISALDSMGAFCKMLFIK